MLHESTPQTHRVKLAEIILLKRNLAVVEFQRSDVQRTIPHSDLRQHIEFREQRFQITAIDGRIRFESIRRSGVYKNVKPHASIRLKGKSKAVIDQAERRVHRKEFNRVKIGPR